MSAAEVKLNKLPCTVLRNRWCWQRVSKYGTVPVHLEGDMTRIKIGMVAQPLCAVQALPACGEVRAAGKRLQHDAPSPMRTDHAARVGRPANEGT